MCEYRSRLNPSLLSRYRAATAAPLFIWSVYGFRMPTTIELDDDLTARIEGHLEEDETIEEFLTELVAIYEQEGRFLQEGA